MKKAIILILVVLAAAVGAFFAFPQIFGGDPSSGSVFSSVESNDDTSENIPTEGTPAESAGSHGLIVHFIDVGQGDSIFVELPNNKTMLIDCGDAEYGDRVVTYIYEQGYETIDYLIPTHAHNDHIGGFPVALDTFIVKQAFITDAMKQDKLYDKLIAAIGTEQVSTVMAGSVICSEDELLVEVAAPKTLEAEDINDTSIVIKLTYGENVFLFAGDAGKFEEDGIWTNIKCDVLKVGHHGSDSSTSRNFLKKTEPKYAVISCGLSNKYGHPTDAVLKRLYERNITLYRTDLQGTVVFSSDGKNITVNKPPSEYPTETIYETSESSATVIGSDGNEYMYVLNTKSHRIHYADCPSVKDIKEKNKAFTNDYEQAIEDGYKPCGGCKPQRR